MRKSGTQGRRQSNQAKQVKRRERSRVIRSENQFSATRKPKGVSEAPLESSFGPGSLAILIGISLGWVIFCLQRAFRLQFDIAEISGAGEPVGLVVSATFTIAVCLLCVGVGARLPRYLAWYIRKRRPGWLWSPRAGDDTSEEDPDRTLLWIIIAASALAAGLTLLLLPWFVDLGGAVYRLAHRHFLWVSPLQLALQVVIVAGVVLIPLLLIGATLLCTQHMSLLARRKDRPLASYVLFGAGTGLTLIGAVTRFVNVGGLAVMVASVPMLLTAMVAVNHSTRVRDTRPDRSVARRSGPRVSHYGAWYALPISISAILWGYAFCDFGGSWISLPTAFGIILWIAGAGAVIGLPHRQRRPLGFGADARAAHVSSCVNLFAVVMVLLASPRVGEVSMVAIVVGSIGTACSGFAISRILCRGLRSGVSLAAGSTRATFLLPVSIAAGVILTQGIVISGVGPVYGIGLCGVVMFVPLVRFRWSERVSVPAGA